jgi:hypothetical protein
VLVTNPMKLQILAFLPVSKFDFIIGGKHQTINSIFHSHRERFVTSCINKSKISGIEIAKQGSREKLNSQAVSTAITVFFDKSDLFRKLIPHLTPAKNYFVV